MMSLPLRLAVLTVLFVMPSVPAEACTTAVISGSATPDGRPLLWKNRDYTAIHNEVVRIDGGPYSLVAVVNCGARKSVWMGMNDAGLCIENSLSRDLANPKGVRGLTNGEFMLEVLKECATVEEVRQFLIRTDATGRSTSANFGVIDAQGGAALFETGYNRHVMFDANDPEVAPQGMIVRSNFSLTGQGFDEMPSEERLRGVYSGERYLRAHSLIAAERAGGLTPKYLIQHCARDLADADGTPYPGTINGAAGDLPDFIPTKNTLSRSTTVSYVVFQGVRPGEAPGLTTMWVGLGDPKFSAAMPYWMDAGEVAAEMQGRQSSPLCSAAISLRERYYTKEPDGITTDGLTGLWQEVRTHETEVFQRVDARLKEWRSQGIQPDSMRAIHLSAAEQSLAILKNQLRLQKAEPATIAPAQ